MIVRLFLIGSILSGCIKSSKAQNGFVRSDFQSTIKVFDASGRSFINPYPDFTGTPFFISKWKSGIITLNNNQVFQNVQFRLNLVTQVVHYLNMNNVEMIISPGVVKELTFFDSTKDAEAYYNDFVSGFPAIDNQTEKSFYLVLCTGKISLLKSFIKKPYVENQLSGEVKREFRLFEEYYFFSDLTMQRLKRNKSAILALLKDKQDKIETFVESNNLSYKKMEDLQRIVRFYNSLEQ